MLEGITKEITNSFLNYLHVYSWLNIQVHKTLTNRKFTFNSIEKFWSMIFNEELKHGDVIKINEGFLTEWIPRVPGQAWQSIFPNSKDKLLDSLKKGSEFSISSIFEGNSTSLGIIRLPFGHDNRNFAMLSVTTYDCWSIDLSIPIIASREVYSQFITAQKNNKSIEGDIEATLEFGEFPLFDHNMLIAMGSGCNEDFVKQYSSPLNVPKVYLRLTSPLNAKFRTHHSHPSGSIWALTNHYQSHIITHNLDNGIVTTSECEPYEFIGLDLAHIDISNVENLQLHANSFKYENSHLKARFPQIKHIENPSKKITVITEFDGRKRYFENSIPIINKPWENSVDKNKILSTLKILEAEHKKKNNDSEFLI